MSGSKDKIERVLSALREGSQSVHANPSESNYRKWEGRIARAGQGSQWGWIVGIGILAAIIFLVIIIFHSPKVTSGCVLFNDNSYYDNVNLRSGCDYQPCGYDESSVAGNFPNGTTVVIESDRSVASNGFTWIPVRIAASGQAGWVASTKIRCQ